MLRRYVGGNPGRGVAFQPWGGRQPTPGWWAARRVVLGPTPERQPLVCSWRLEGNLAVTHKFSTSTLCVSSLLSLCDKLQRSFFLARARASDSNALAASSFHPTPFLCLARKRATAGRRAWSHRCTTMMKTILSPLPPWRPRAANLRPCRRHRHCSWRSHRTRQPEHSVCDARRTRRDHHWLRKSCTEMGL